MSIKDLLALKQQLKNINNEITLETTLLFVDFLKESGVISEVQCSDTKAALQQQSVNTNGFDVCINDTNTKIIAEVKCNSPVNKSNGFGAAQEQMLIKDLCGLLHGKTKAKITVDDYVKYMVLLIETPDVISAMHKLLNKLGATIKSEDSETQDKNLLYIVYIDPTDSKPIVETVKLNI